MKKTPPRLLRTLLYLLLPLTLALAFFSEGQTRAALMLGMGIVLIVAGLLQMLLLFLNRKD